MFLGRVSLEIIAQETFVLAIFGFLQTNDYIYGKKNAKRGVGENDDDEKQAEGGM